uniref:Uncharacterized protein n=1 Tax=Tanacetum cinerariifolium TaxID=118510 RepID=A0A699GWW9_TANCI|nr:hypothetical protein [Tanacetum cinerariifolium]
MVPLPPRDQRHPRLRYQVEGYTDDIVHNYEQRLEMIFGRMVYTRDEGQEIFTSHTWRRLFEIRAPARHRMTLRQFILALGLHTGKEMADDSFGHIGWVYLFRHAEGKKRGARLYGGHFFRHLASHLGLVSDQGLRGLSVVTQRQSDAAAGTLGAVEDAHVVDEGAQADPAPMQVPQLPPPTPKTMPQRITRLEEEVQELRQSIVGLRGDVDISITNQAGSLHGWSVA